MHGMPNPYFERSREISHFFFVSSKQRSPSLISTKGEARMEKSNPNTPKNVYIPFIMAI